jgi:hypothetical protein
MAIPSTGAPAPASAPSLTRGPSLAGSALVLDGQRDPWTYCASPSSLGCYLGEVVPSLAKAWWTPGHNGNGRDDALVNQGKGAILRLADEGYVPIPHDIECVAFGETRSKADTDSGRLSSTYLNMYQGTKGAYWVDAWHRPRKLGHMVVWDFDEDGWRDFLVRCMKHVQQGEELDAAQVEIALRNLRRKAGAVANRKDHHAAAVIEQVIRHLPRAHAPKAMLQHYPEDAEPAPEQTSTTTTKGGRKRKS